MKHNVRCPECGALCSPVILDGPSMWKCTDLDCQKFWNENEMQKFLPWKNPRLTLGARCVLLAKHELMNFEPSSSRVREYFSGCVRDYNGRNVRLGLTRGNWCAAFASWCLEQCAFPRNRHPHKWRAGVVEIVADAKKSGLYHPADGTYAPKEGDLLIWDRSEPGNPETSWWRHVNRLVSVDGAGLYTTIGGNESGTIRLITNPPKRLHPKKLLGFVSYSFDTSAPQHITTEEELKNDRNLIANFVEAHRRSLRA